MPSNPKFPLQWNPHLPRTREGYYRFKGGLEAALYRAIQFSPFSDLIWVETKKPDLNQAKSIAKHIKEKFPNKLSSFPQPQRKKLKLELNQIAFWGLIDG